LERFQYATHDLSPLKEEIMDVLVTLSLESFTRIWFELWINVISGPIPLVDHRQTCRAWHRPWVA
jgi:hypothetical protein